MLWKPRKAPLICSEDNPYAWCDKSWADTYGLF